MRIKNSELRKKETKMKQTKRDNEKVNQEISIINETDEFHVSNNYKTCK